MTSIELSRVVQADPSSVALVLAGPAARELWPHPVAERPVAAVGAGATEVTVDPPRRTGVGFAARVLVRDAGATVGAGRLTIRPARTESGCELALVLTARDDHDQRLGRDAAVYLDNVARISRERSSAA